MNAFVDDVLQPALVFLGEWSLRWAVPVAVLAVVLGLLRPRRPATRHLLCLAVLLAGLLLPAVPCWGPGWPVLGERHGVSPPVTGELRDVSPPQGTTTGGLTPRRSPETPRSLPQAADVPHFAEKPENKEPLGSLGTRRLGVLGLAGAWVAGVLVLVARWGAGWAYLRRLGRTAAPLAGPAADLLAACRADLGLRAGVRLGLHAAVRSPVLFGLRRPVILVPDDWPALSAAAQRAGLLHELAHLARGDHRAVPLLQLVRVLFFFHPGVRWLLARLESERELLCDEAVVALGVEPHDYARILLEFAGRGGRLGSAPLGVANPITIKVRIHHLLEETMPRLPSPPARRRTLALGALVLTLAAALGAVRVRALAPEAPPPKNKEEAAPANKPYRIAPFDVLNVRVESENAVEVHGPHLVEPDGRLDLGLDLGRVSVGSRTLDEANAIVQKRVGERFKSLRASVGLAGWVGRWRNDPARQHPYRIKPYQVLNINARNTLPAFPIAGPHLVDPDGKVDLGPSYGRVAVEGLSLEEAAAAVRKRLGEVLKEPQVSVTLGGWEKSWHDLTRLDSPESDAHPEPPDREAPAVKPQREALRYGGKNFDQWRTQLATELSPAVRAEAMKAMSAFGANGYGADAAAAILETMKGYDLDKAQNDQEDKPVVYYALEGCAKLDAAAVPVFRQGLKSSNRNVRAMAIAGLLYMKSTARAALPDLIGKFEDGNFDLRFEALNAARQIDPRSKQLIPALLHGLKDESAGIRATAAVALAEVGTPDKAVVAALVAALEDPEGRVRLASYQALRNLGAIKPALVPKLAALVKDKNADLRDLVYRDLRDLGPGAKAAVPALIEALKENTTRMQAICCLGAIGPDARDAIPALKDFYRSDDETIRRCVTAAVLAINR
jgi:beta-lactamase regulating signal transducer with metallopeptidase domain/HEAT repeat protein